MVFGEFIDGRSHWWFYVPGGGRSVPARGQEFIPPPTSRDCFPSLEMNAHMVIIRGRKFILSKVKDLAEVQANALSGPSVHSVVSGDYPGNSKRATQRLAPTTVD